MSFVKPDGSIFQRTSEIVLAIGQTAIILRHGPHALKVPKVRPLDSLKDDENRTIAIYNGGARRELANEQEVYRRLGQHNGIAQCINISDDGTLLAFYKRGTLEDYIRDEKEVEPVRKAEWMGSLTNTHLGFYDAKILVNDIFLRNILIADDLSLKMIDFGKFRLLPADTDMDQINDRGMTAQVEMHHLGSVFYSIATWTNYEWDYCCKEEKLPAVEKLPDVRDVFCGDVIRKCWSRGYPSMQQLYDELLEISSALSSVEALPRLQRIEAHSGRAT